MQISIKKTPDSVYLEGENGYIKADKKGDVFESIIGCVEFCNNGNALGVLLAGNNAPVKRIRIRWNCDFSQVLRVMGDSPGVARGDLGWYSVIPDRPMTWYFCVANGKTTNGYGVKTGCNSFAFWQCDSCGITLILDVRNGGEGVLLKETLSCAEIVEYIGKEGENSYFVTKTLCKLMCDKPNIPKRPVFGLNNWYYAYGNISRESVLEDARLTAELCGGLSNRPFMLIDDGWQKERCGEYIGGPFTANEKFGDMTEVAQRITEIGCEPAIWIRPLLTKDKLPDSYYHPRKTSSAGVTFLDPSCEGVLEYVSKVVSSIANMGYKLIKYDFTAPDMMTDDIYDEIYIMYGLTHGGWHFADRSITNAQITKRLYKTIQDSANGSYIMGCNTYNHLAAGIHEIQRSGLDTSGVEWEKTRRNGINCLAFREPQNKTFFLTDGDCPAFTEKVSTELNMRFLELSALAGSCLFASVTPGLLNAEEKKRVSKAFEVANRFGEAEPLDWENTNCPTKYKCGNDIYTFNWFDETDGVII